VSKVYLHTTEIPVERTVDEIEKEIARHGATQIRTEWDKDGRVVGLAFLVTFPGKAQYPVSLPCRYEKLRELLADELTDRQRREWERSGRLEATAYRVGWRQLLYWVRAQFALIDLGMGVTAEVFLPYVEVEPHKRYYERLVEKGLKALGPGTAEDQPEGSDR
jgi:hypothetical protein